jgi:hypothetical protein
VEGTGLPAFSAAGLAATDEVEAVVPGVERVRPGHAPQGAVEVLR